LKKQLALGLVIASFGVLVGARDARADDSEVCWKDTDPRGAGTIPTECKNDQTNSAGLCYDACPSGWVGVGPACHVPCPSGWTPVGADPTAVSCWKPLVDRKSAISYGRGAGYALWDKDKCNKKHSQGCEKDGALYYPKCKTDYKGVGPVCWQQHKSCPADFRDDGLACAKPALRGRGAGKIPTACAGGKEYQAGLCYKPCSADQKAVGPVCWDKCPAAFPVDCGAMCGQSVGSCAMSITSQVMTTLEVVGNIASCVLTAGASSAAIAGAKTAAQMGAEAAMKGAVKDVSEASAKAIIKDVVKSTVKTATKDQVKAQVKKAAKESGKTVTENQLDNIVNAATGDDFDFTTLDPTGIASMVQSYNLPKCSKAAAAATSSTKK
jgi:hypothetical protein